MFAFSSFHPHSTISFNPSLLVTSRSVTDSHAAFIRAVIPF